MLLKIPLSPPFGRCPNHLIVPIKFAIQEKRGLVNSAILTLEPFEKYREKVNLNLMKQLNLSVSCAVLALAVGWLQQSSAATTFPLQGDDTTPSMGVFRIVVDPAFRGLMGPVGAMPAYTGYKTSDGRLTSPLLIDNTTTIGRSDPHTTPYPAVFPIAIGAGSWDSIAGYADYAAIPTLWSAAPINTREVLTEIKSFILLSVTPGSDGKQCPPDPRIPSVPLSWPMVKAGTIAGVSPRSLGIVQQNVPGDPSDFPARSFFDIFVEVNLPRIPGTESDLAFPPTGAVLTNGSPLLITNLDLQGFPPSVIYIHGGTPAVPVKFKANNPPYWTAGDTFGYLVLAGHGTITSDCTDPNGQGALLDTVLGPIGNPKPEMSVEWPHTNALCPSAGTSYDSVKDDDVISFGTIKARNFSHSNFPNPITPPALNSTAIYSAPNTLVTFEISMDNGANWSAAQATGLVEVSIHHTSDVGTSSTFDTEMTKLDIQGVGPSGPFQVRESPSKQSLGKHTIRPDGSVFRISSFFDVFLELSIPGRTPISADRSIRVQPTPPPLPPIGLNCSTNITVTASGQAGAVVYFSSSATGGCAPVTVNCIPPSGSTFPVGTNVVTCTATDACGQTTNCSFTITVKPLTNDPCQEPDNGSGTVTLPPPGCQYLSPDQVHLIIAGLPAGTTIELAAIHKDFICHEGQHPCTNDCYATGSCNPTNGGNETFDSTLQLHLVGTGSLLGWVRDLTIPNVSCQSQVGPRYPGAPVQSFDTEMMQVQGQLPPGDPDFDLLRMTAGSGFGLPSPGHTTLTQLPGGNWAVDSFFDITYRIDFVGNPTGKLGGMSGSTMGTIRMVAVRPPNNPLVVNCSTNITVTATSATGAVVSFNSSTTGGCTPVKFSCNPPSGSTFPIGTTVVTCNASDACNATQVCEFTVTVNPLPSIKVTCSTNVTVTTTSANGAAVSYSSSATGGCDGQPTLVCNPPSGSNFPIGTTTVTCTANNTCGETAECTFTVTVVRLTLTIQPFGKDVRVIWSTGTLQEAGKAEGLYIDIDPQPTSPWTVTPSSAKRFFRVRSGQPGFTFYDTEMLQLDIAGGNLPAGMMIRESPTLVSTGKTAISPAPGGGFIIDSFFDVFTELSTDGGSTWEPAIGPPPHMRSTSTATANNLPPRDANYVSPADWHAAYAVGIYLTNASHFQFTGSFPPPPPGGVTNTHTFSSTVNMQVRLTPTGAFQPVSATAQVKVEVKSRP